MGELGDSELGTQEYWESRYSEEIKNFSNHGDPGEIWFGEDIVDRIIKWMNKMINKNSKIVDIGCGNGMLLVELANEGYTNLIGIDYSHKAVDLAKAIAEKHRVNITYLVCNVLSGIDGDYDVIHDKGTYDAVSLSENSKTNRQTYIENVFNCLKESGYFIITSCNWTESELDEHFNRYFVRLEIIPTPQFKFGGKVGNVVSSCVYKKI